MRLNLTSEEEAKREKAIDLNSGFISLILRDFSLSSGAFYLEKGALALPFDKNLKNLRELSYENMQNKLRVQVIEIFMKDNGEKPDGNKDPDLRC